MAPATHCDVVVVGAGLSGLVAAKRLDAAGTDVRVLEGTGRVGGRTLTSQGPDCVLDLGASFLSDEQDRVCALVDALDLHRVESYDRGRNVSRLAGRDHRWRGGFPFLGLRTSLAAARMIRTLDAMSARPEVRCPPRDVVARRWDSHSVQDWVEHRKAPIEAKELVSTGIRLIFASELRDISLLHLLFCLKSAGGFRSYIRTRGRDQLRISGGAQQICEQLAARLSVVPTLNAAVTSIHSDAATVKVCTADGRSLSARRVILAVPPVALRSLVITPELPENRRAAFSHALPGAVIKLSAVYPAPFWRSDGMSGKFTALEGALSICMDSSPPGGPGVLTIATVADSARQLQQLGRDDAVRILLDNVAEVLGEQARAPMHVDFHEWHDDVAGGGYAGVFGPGVWTAHGAGYRTPWYGVHFAGTETAQRFYGSLEGAVCAGERAADEVLAVLPAAHQVD